MNNTITSSPLIVVMGHYGSGKTNFALNLALHLKDEGKDPLLVDLDVVNPYFRSTDFAAFMEEQEIAVIGPVFGASNLDAPSLSPAIEPAIHKASLERPLILDVGGDPDGARALARFAPAILKRGDALVLSVVNLKRPETQTSEDNEWLISELESQSGLKLNGLVGNTHLAEFTSLQTVCDSLPTLKEISQKSGLSLLCVTVPFDEVSEKERIDLALALGDSKGEKTGDSFACENDTLMSKDVWIFPVKKLVKTVWQ